MHMYHIYYVYTFIYILLIPLSIYFFFDIYYSLTVTGTVLLDKSERTK